MINNRRRKEIMSDLKAKNFAPFPTKVTKNAEDDSSNDETASQEEGAVASASDYDYLLRMPLWSLTLEKV